jgi:hypothetical protein
MALFLLLLAGPVSHFMIKALADELLYEGSSIYLYGKETGIWKIFFHWTVDRE